MEPTNGLNSLKIALLIDFDNVLLGIDDPGFDVELVVNALRERGSIVMGRCYGDWYRHNRHRRKLMEQGLELVETPAFGPVIKNSADIRIALDGLEIGMTQHHIDTFCLVSGDSDFLPLIKKLQYLGKKVLVICGTRFTSDMLRRNCNEFISYENLLAQSVGATEDATTLEGSFALLHRAMETLRERGAEIRSSTVKQMMLQLNPVFSERNFGCPQFRGFLDKAVARNLIKLGSRDKTSGEFLVLLPEEEEEIRPEPVVEVKAPRGRTPREPRAPRESKLVIKNPVVAEAPREDALVAATGADIFAPAANHETDDHATTSANLLSRGLRRGRLKFSGRTGRPERIEAASNAGDDSPAPDAPPDVTADGNEPREDETPDLGTLESLADQVAQRAEEISVGTLPKDEMETAPELVAVLEAKDEADAPKKPARRRRRGGGNGERAVKETIPKDDAEAARNVADAEAIGLTFPGEAFEISEENAAPVETLAETAPAIVSETVPDDAAQSAAEAEVAEAPKKPVRRRRTTRKKAEEGAEASS